MVEAVAMRACDYVMPDVTRIGGVTGWMQAAGIAAASNIEMSSHLMPELSVHLLAATPTAHWIEYVDWADAILQEPLELVDGAASAPDRPALALRGAKTSFIVWTPCEPTTIAFTIRANAAAKDASGRDRRRARCGLP